MIYYLLNFYLDDSIINIVFTLLTYNLSIIKQRSDYMMEKVNNLLSQIGYKEFNVLYNQKNIIINQDSYLYSDISDVLCIVEPYDAVTIKAGGNYGHGINLERDEMTYLMSLLNGNDNDIKIELDAVYLLIRDRHYNEKRYMIGIFPNDDDELAVCKNKGEGWARGIIEYCHQLNELEKNINHNDQIDKIEEEEDEEDLIGDLLESLLNGPLPKKKNELQKVKPKPANDLVKAKQELTLMAGMYFDEINYPSGWYDIQVIAGSGYFEYYANNVSKKIYLDVNDELCRGYRNLFLDAKSSISINTGIKVKLIYIGKNPR